jgi:hypothetical protein
MAQADDLNTTNRRVFLSTMAAGIAAGGALALAAVPASAVSLTDDPVFAVIDAHAEALSTLREAEAAHALAEREIEYGELFPGIFTTTNRVYCASYGNATQAGNTFWPFMTSHADIDKYSPPDLYPEDNKAEHEELSAKILRRDTLMHPLQEAMDDAWDAERAAFEELLETVPTTMPGAMALLKWHRERDG